VCEHLAQFTVPNAAVDQSLLYTL